MIISYNSREWLTANEIAEKIGLKVQTFYRKFRNNELPYIESKRKELGQGFLYRICKEKAEISENETTQITPEIKTLVEMLKEKDKQLEHYMTEFFRLQSEIGQNKLLTEGQEKELSAEKEKIEVLKTKLAEKEKQVELLTRKKWWQIWK